jgi:hypothetical protein
MWTARIEDTPKDVLLQRDRQVLANHNAALFIFPSTSSASAGIIHVDT